MTNLDLAISITIDYLDRLLNNMNLDLPISIHVDCLILLLFMITQFLLLSYLLTKTLLDEPATNIYHKDRVIYLVNEKAKMPKTIILKKVKHVQHGTIFYDVMGASNHHVLAQVMSRGSLAMLTTKDGLQVVGYHHHDAISANPMISINKTYKEFYNVTISAPDLRCEDKLSNTVYK